MAPWIRSSGTTSRAQRGRRRRELVAGGGRRVRARTGRRRHRRRRPPGGSSRRSSRRASPRRSRPGIDRSTMPTTRSVRLPPSFVGTSRGVVHRRPSRSASAAGTIAAPPGVERGERRIPVAVDEARAGRRRPGRRRRRRRASVRVALDGDVEGRDRAHPGDARGRRRSGPRRPPRRRRSGGWRSRRASPGTTSAIQAGGGRAGVLAHPAERDDHRQPDGQAAEGQRASGSGRGPASRGRAAPRTGRWPRTARRRPGRWRAGRTGSAAWRRAGSRRRRGPGRRRSPPAPRGRTSTPTSATTPKTTASQRSRARPRGRAIESRRECLDRLDAAGPAGRLEGGREGHPDPDDRARRRWRRAAGPGARG